MTNRSRFWACAIWRRARQDRSSGRDEMNEVARVRPPMWRKVVNFPLVAMLIALAIAIFCFAAGKLLATYLLPPIPGFTESMRFDLVSLPLLILAYELVIRHLGEEPRDDYRDPKALPRLGLGL